MHRHLLQSFSVFCAHHTHVHARARAPANPGSGSGPGPGFGTATGRMAARSTSGRTFSTTTTAPFIRKMLGNSISSSIRLARKPPIARIERSPAHEAIWHGRPRIDEYVWMQRPQSEHELAEYLRQETQYARSSMKGSARLQRQIAAEMHQATEVHTMPPPVETESGGFVYYVRQNAGGSTVYCRRPANARSEQVLVDGEQLARRDGYELRTLLVSDDHDCFACLAAPLHDSHKALSESSSLLVYSLSISGEVKLVETLENVFNFAFGPRNTVFYTVLDEKLRAHRVMGHRIGRPQTEDAVVFDEPDAECFVDITRTKDKRYHIVNSSTLDSSELRVFRSDCDFWQTQSCGSSHCDQIRLIRRRQKNVEYFIDHHSGEFVILTNCPKDPSSFDSVVEPLPFRLLRAPTEQPEARDWTELLSVSDSERIEDVEVFEKHIVVSVKRQGLPAVVVYNRQLDSRAELRLPYNGNCTVRPEPSPQYNASTIRLSFSSPVHLESVAEYNLDSRDMCNSWSATPLHIDSGDFVVRQVRVPHGDVVVPVTLIHPEAAYWSQNASPTLIRVYGAYGVSLEPEFRLEDIPLLRRGWTIALAHVRGGGELGRQWYAGGKGFNKHNSIADLLACTRYLLEKNWSEASKLALTGASAGGLVVGAALNAEPSYFRAAALHVPFVDPLSSMLDPDLPLTGVEVSEWGNPLANLQDYDAISRYAPYDNIKACLSADTPMPSILVTAGGQDKRVSVWQPAKWVARMRSKAGYSTPTATKHGSSSKLLFLASANTGHFHSHNSSSDDSDVHDNSDFITAHALRNAFFITETSE